MNKHSERFYAAHRYDPQGPAGIHTAFPWHTLALYSPWMQFQQALHDLCGGQSRHVGSCTAQAANPVPSSGAVADQQVVSDLFLPTGHLGSPCVWQ